MRTAINLVAAAVIGAAVGYLTWLAVMSAVTFVVHPKHLVLAGGIVVILLTAAAVVIAIRCSRRERKAASLAFWCAPIGPLLASVYALAVLAP